MTIPHTDQRGHQVWTVAEAKAHLSEILRLAKDEPQYLGVKNQYVIVPKEEWEEVEKKKKPHMGKWLLENFSGLDIDLEIPDRKEKSDTSRKIPFIDEE